MDNKNSEQPKWKKYAKNLTVATALTGAGGFTDGTIEDAYAQRPKATQTEKTPIRKLSQPEKTAIAKAAKHIRESQLPDGPIRMGSDGDPVWVVPYFAHEAALGSLAAYAQTKNKDDIKVAAKWLKWCCDNREEGGYTAEREGFISRGYPKKMDNGKPKTDAVDSDVALFLAVADRYHASLDKLPLATKKMMENILPPALLEKHAGICLDTLKDLRDPGTGLTYAKPDYPVMYLMDNGEVKIGLEAGARLFKRLGKEDQATECGEMAAKIGEELTKFYDPNKKWFAHARHPSGQYDFDEEKPYPGGMAQAFGLALADIPDADKKAVWEKFTNNKAFTSGEVIPRSRLLPAAEAVGNQKHQKSIHDRLLGDGDGPKIQYVDTSGLTILSLAEGGIGKYAGETKGKAK